MSYHPAVGDVGSIPTRLRPLFDASAFEEKIAPGPNDWLALHHEPGQTFDEYRRSQPNRPSATRDAIYIEPLGQFNHASPPRDALGIYAAAFFQMRSLVLEPMNLDACDVTQRINPYGGQRQLLTTDLLEALFSQLPSDAYCLIGVTMTDLYPHPDWNFVFGQASLRERVGVYSFARYDSRDPKVRLKRSLKVLVHEIGHMFGLRHCVYFECVMNGSNHLDEADARPMHLCPVCLRKLAWNTGFDPLRRYRELSEVYEALGFDAHASWVRMRAEASSSPR